jgi:hypothetical protein
MPCQCNPPWGAKDSVEKDESDIVAPQLTGFQHDLLLRLDLQYLMEYCYPTLPDHHQAKLLRILAKDLWVNKHQHDVLSRNPSFKLPARLGYKNPQSLHALPTNAPTLQYGKSSMILPPIRPPDDRKEFSLRSDINGTARLLEQLLAFHAFAKYGRSLLSAPESVEKYEKSFLTMMNALKECSIRRDEHGGDYKIQKFLECLHLQKDHMRYGPTVEHNSDTGERRLKFWAKLVAVTAQNWRGDNIFKNQVARNTQEVEMLDILETSYLLRQGKMPEHKQEELLDADGPLLICTMGKNFCFSLTEDGSSIHSIDGRSGAPYRTPKNNFHLKLWSSWSKPSGSPSRTFHPLGGGQEIDHSTCNRDQVD